MIELKHLTKEFHTRTGKVVALSDVNLTIGDGSIYGVIGLSGAGKSTLVRCINLLERPTAGSIIVDGEDVTKLKKKRLLELRRNIGMIFQNFNLLEQRTVEANVRLPLELSKMPSAAARERVGELLALVGLSEKAKAYPSQLSGGQKQRVAIARALATSPKYLLCDEATSALDPNTTSTVLSLLRSINRNLGVAMIVITHEMRVVEQICTDVAVIDDSRIAECGRVRDVFSFPQSEIAKRLIIPELVRSVAGHKEQKLRLVFNGQISDMPIISGLALEHGIAVNILYADTKSIDGRAFGHMVIALPPERERAETVKRYLEEKGVEFKEEI